MFQTVKKQKESIINLGIYFVYYKNIQAIEI
jgi:hypothetical protein